jgi:hypothetical protein
MKKSLEYRIREKARKEFERTKCDPEEHKIEYCKDLNSNKCPRTCYYATKREN